MCIMGYSISFYSCLIKSRDEFEIQKVFLQIKIMYYMKKVFFLFMFIPFICWGQEISYTKDSIPVRNNKVVFTKECNTQLNAGEIHEKINYWLNNSFMNKSSVINANDSLSGLIVCRTVDCLEIESQTLAIFSIYMKYVLAFEYKDNFCKITIKNIQYIEPEEVQKQIQTKVPEMESFSSEFVLVERKYKQLFKKNAVSKIAQCTRARVSHIFEDVEKVLKN